MNLHNQSNQDDLAAAYAFVDSMVERADTMVESVYPAWHGWALREAYLAGVKAERERQEREKRRNEGT